MERRGAKVIHIADPRLAARVLRHIRRTHSRLKVGPMAATLIDERLAEYEAQAAAQPSRTA